MSSRGGGLHARRWTIKHVTQVRQPSAKWQRVVLRCEAFGFRQVQVQRAGFPVLFCGCSPELASAGSVQRQGYGERRVQMAFRRVQLRYGELRNPQRELPVPGRVLRRAAGGHS